MKKTGKRTQRGYENPVAEKKEGVFRDWLKFEKHKHYDEDLEAAVIGITLLESDSMARVRRFLQPEFFYYEFHQCVWRAECELFDQGFPIDILTVVNWIYTHDKDPFITQMEAMGRGIPWEVARLTNQVVSSAHMDYWAYLIREQYVSRKLLEMTTGGMAADSTREELIRVQNQIDDLLQYKVSANDWEHISSTLVRLWQHMIAIEGKEMIGLPTGFKHFDKMTSGITPGLIYLAARPSVGKTALAMKWIMNHAVNEDPVGIISLETPGVKLGARMLSMVSNVEYWRIYRNKMSEELQKKVYGYTGSMDQLPIWISDQPAVNISDIRAKVWKLKKQGAKAIYLDYIQLVEPEEAGTREQEVAKLSRGLKLLTMQADIPIIALAQLSRESEKRADKTPKLIDLRESGSLEQDADGVILLHRPYKSGILTNEDGSSTENEAQLIVAKWKDGETFEWPLIFKGDRMEFSEDEVKIAEREGWNKDQKALPNTHTAPPRDYTRPRSEERDDDLPF